MDAHEKRPTKLPRPTEWPRPTKLLEWEVFSFPEKTIFDNIVGEEGKERFFNRANYIEPFTVYFIDGTNIFYGPEKKWKRNVVAEAFKEVEKAGEAPWGPCIVVCSRESYVNSIEQGYYSKAIETLQPIVSNKYPIFFCYMDIPRCTIPSTASPCLQRDGSKCSYKMGGYVKGPYHMLCEFDDVLLTRLFAQSAAELRRRYNCGVFLVSGDREVNKDQEVVSQVSKALMEMGDSVKFGIHWVEKLPSSASGLPEWSYKYNLTPSG